MEKTMQEMAAEFNAEANLLDFRWITKAILLVIGLDDSGSMELKVLFEGKQLTRLQVATHSCMRMLRNLASDETIRNNLVLFVYTFGGSVKTLLKGVLLRDLDLDKFEQELPRSGYGHTPMAQMMLEADEDIQEFKRKLAQNGVPYYQPIVSLITDGDDNSPEEVLGRAYAVCDERISDGKMAFLPVGIGKDDMVELDSNGALKRPYPKLARMARMSADGEHVQILTCGDQIEEYFIFLNQTVRRADPFASASAGGFTTTSYREFGE